MDWAIENGTALVDGRLRERPVWIEGAVMAATPPVDATAIDARGLLVLPGIVDLHGDGFERQIMPRPGVHFDVSMALRDTDRQLIANGITTAFHGVTITWEPGLRSLSSARLLVAAIGSLRGELMCDTRLHLRWETFALDEADQVLAWLELEPKPILAFNDHTTGSVNKTSIARKMAQWAERAGVTIDEYARLLETAWSRRDEVEPAIAKLAAAGRVNGNVLLAHDEASRAEREKFRALGARASEFPLTIDTARAAREAGEHVILGAPNIVRGGSHNGAMNAADAIAASLCTVLASDYHYPSPLHAAFKLATAKADDLAAAWALVSENPAEVAGLSDRGSLAAGKRADLLLVDAGDPAHPAVVGAWVAGELVYSRRRLAHSERIAAAA